VADPVAQSKPVTLPDVAKPSQAPAPGEPTVITVPAAGSGQSEPYADDDDAEGGNKAYGEDESEKDGEQYENGDDESSYADQEQGEDHEDEGEYDDDDD
jgi:hypothetical protein